MNPAVPSVYDLLVWQRGRIGGIVTPQQLVASLTRKTFPWTQLPARYFPACLKFRAMDPVDQLRQARRSYAPQPTED